MSASIHGQKPLANAAWEGEWIKRFEKFLRLEQKFNLRMQHDAFPLDTVHDLIGMFA